MDVRSPVWVAPRVTFLRKATWSCIDCCILTVSTTHARNKNVNSTCYHPKRDALKLLITIVVLLVGNLNLVNSLMIMEIIWISENIQTITGYVIIYFGVLNILSFDWLGTFFLTLIRLCKFEVLNK